MPRLITFERRLDWELTTRCNLSCGHCISRLYHRKVPRELDAGEALAILERCREAGIDAVHFFGGEPTVRPDLPALLHRCEELGIEATFNTNGTALGPEVLAALAARRRPRPLSLSLEDVRPAAHDEIRGPGSFAAAAEGIARYLDATGGAELVVAFTLTRPALAELSPGEILEALGALGAGHVVFQDLAVPASGPARLRRLAYDGALWRAFLAALFDPALSPSVPFTYQLKPLVADHLNRTLGLSLPLAYYGCDGLSVTFRLLPNGTLLPCSAAVGWPEALERYLEGAPTLLERSLEELLELPLYQEFARCKRARGGDPWLSPCRECPFAYVRCNPCVFGRLIGRESAIQTCAWIAELGR